jgi:hypothetical protein
MTHNGHTGPPRVRLSSGFRCVSTTSSNSKVGICRKLAPCRSKPGNQDEAKNGGCTMGKAPNGGFLNWRGTSFIIHFNRIFHYKSSIFGFPHLWKPPNEKLGGRLNEDPWTAPMALSRACKFFDRAWSLPRLSWPGSRIIMGYHLPSGKHAWQLNILVLMWFEWENNLWMMDFPVPCLTTGGYMFVSIAMFDYQRKTLKRNHVCGLAQPSCSWTVPRFIQLTSGVDCALPFLGWTSKYHWMVLFSFFLVKLYFSMALYISTAFSLQCLSP